MFARKPKAPARLYPISATMIRAADPCEGALSSYLELFGEDPVLPTEERCVGLVQKWPSANWFWLVSRLIAGYGQPGYDVAGNADDVLGQMWNLRGELRKDMRGPEANARTFARLWLQHGPAPEFRHLVPITADLVRAADACPAGLGQYLSAARHLTGDAEGPLVPTETHCVAVVEEINWAGAAIRLLADDRCEYVLHPTDPDRRPCVMDRFDRWAATIRREELGGKRGPRCKREASARAFARMWLEEGPKVDVLESLAWERRERKRAQA